MKTIVITIRIMASDEEFEIKVHPQMTAIEILDHFFEEGIIDTNDPEGNTYQYEFISKESNKLVRGNITLEEVNIESGDILYCVPRLVTGDRKSTLNNEDSPSSKSEEIIIAEREIKKNTPSRIPHVWEIKPPSRILIKKTKTDKPTTSSYPTTPPSPWLTESKGKGILDYLGGLFSSGSKKRQQVEQVKEKNSQGKIMYQVPRSMPMGTKQIATVRISKETLNDSILSEGLDQEKVEKSKIKIGKIMQVELFEGSHSEHFSIIPFNNLEQVFNEELYSEWKFQLQPKKIGPYTLVLRVSLKVFIPNHGEKTQDLAVWCNEIQVKVGNAKTEMNIVEVKQKAWNQTFKKQLKQKIGQNEFSLVFQDLANLLQTTDSDLFNDLVILQSKWNTLQREKLLGIHDANKITNLHNQISYSLLNLIDNIGNPLMENALASYKSEINGYKNLINT